MLVSALLSRRRAPAPTGTPATSHRRAAPARRLLLAAVAALTLTAAAATPAMAADTVAPSAPGPLTQQPIDFGVVTLSWGASTDDVGVTGYTVLDGTTVVTTTSGAATSTTYTSPVYGPTGFHQLTVVAKDAAGNTSAPSNLISTSGCGFDIYGATPAAGVVASAITSTSANLSWTPGIHASWCYHAVTGYEVVANGLVKATLTANQTSLAVADLAPSTAYAVQVVALPRPISTGGSPATPPSVSFTTKSITPPADTQAPSAPGPLVQHPTDFGKSTLTWGKSTDDTAVTEYDLLDGTAVIGAFSGATTTTEFDSQVLAQGPHSFGNYTLTVVAKDAAGNVSTPSNVVQTSGCVFDIYGATAPALVSVASVTDTSATISWTTSTPFDWCHHAATGYDIAATTSGGSVASSAFASGGQTSVTLGGLAPGTTYTVTIRANPVPSAPGSTSTAKIPLTTTNTVPLVQDFTYGVAGTATLKNLVKGSLPLTGSAKGHLTPSTGAFSTDLSLNPSTANLIALGFLPVTATVNFVSVAPVAGQLTGNTLTALAKVRIKLPTIKTLGIPIAGGFSNCQATQVSNIPLTSTLFAAASGGTLTGVFSISNLTGCGPLTGLVSTLTAGNGNAIALKLTPVVIDPLPPVITT